MSMQMKSDLTEKDKKIQSEVDLEGDDSDSLNFSDSSDDSDIDEYLEDPKCQGGWAPVVYFMLKCAVVTAAIATIAYLITLVVNPELATKLTWKGVVELIGGAAVVGGVLGLFAYKGVQHCIDRSESNESSNLLENALSVYQTGPSSSKV